jgi:hypothetical protein
VICNVLEGMLAIEHDRRDFALLWAVLTLTVLARIDEARLTRTWT